MAYSVQHLCSREEGRDLVHVVRIKDSESLSLRNSMMHELEFSLSLEGNWKGRRIAGEGRGSAIITTLSAMIAKSAKSAKGSLAHPTSKNLIIKKKILNNHLCS